MSEIALLFKPKQELFIIVHVKVWIEELYLSQPALDEKYRFSKTETLLKLYGNLELKFPV